MKLNKSQMRSILEITYPEYKGRKFKLEFEDKYYPQNYWSGGTRLYFTCLEATDEGIKRTSWGDNPFKQDAHKTFDIPFNGLVVEHTIFCGKDLGITVYINPQSDLLAKQLTI